MYAEIYWLTTEEGGRKTPIVPDKHRAYWANTQIKDKNAWSVGVYFTNIGQVKLGTTGKYEIRFLTPEALRAFQLGCVLYICEGAKIVGRGIILN